MVWVLLSLVAFLQLIGAHFTYLKSSRDSWYFVPFMIIVSLCSSLAWCLSARILDKTSNIMFYSLVWDTVLFISYYAVPLILHRNEFNGYTVIGSILVISGLLVCKLASN